MTASEIARIAINVGVIQLICDILARYLVFNKDPYQRAVGQLDRAKWKLDRAEADLKKNPQKNAKRHARALEDYQEACSDVAKRHSGPGMFSSIFFIIVLKILGTEYAGNIMAVLPFTPFQFFTRITARGLEWKSIPEAVLNETSLDAKRATSFLFIYLLATFSVKHYVHKLAGVAAPPGADQGMLSIMEGPRMKRALKSMGLDPDEMK